MPYRDQWIRCVFQRILDFLKVKSRRTALFVGRRINLSAFIFESIVRHTHIFCSLLYSIHSLIEHRIYTSASAFIHLICSPHTFVLIPWDISDANIRISSSTYNCRRNFEWKRRRTISDRLYISFLPSKYILISGPFQNFSEASRNFLLKKKNKSNMLVVRISSIFVKFSQLIQK